MTHAYLVLWIIFIVILVDYSSNGEEDDLKLDDRTTVHDKILMVRLANELLKDAKLKQRQIMFIRKKQRIFLDYEIGLLMGKIREKYKRMMEIYMEATNIDTKKTDFTAPGRDYNKPLHHIIYMEQIHTLEVEIDMIIRIIEGIPADTLEMVDMTPPRSTTVPTEKNVSTTNTTSSDTNTNTTTKNRKLRLRADDHPPESDTETATSSSATEKLEFISEDDLKQYNREKYERRKGHNTNWTLDEYYGF